MLLAETEQSFFRFDKGCIGTGNTNENVYLRIYKITLHLYILNSFTNLCEIPHIL